MKTNRIGWLLMSIAILLSITLSVIKLNVDKEQSFLCKLIEESPTMMIENCPAHQNNTSWWILVGFLGAIFIFGSGIYLLLFSDKEGAASQSEIERGSEMKISPQKEVTELPEEEQKIYEMIKLNQGSLYQSDVIKQTGLSKVKVSRILDRMEGKGIIDRKRRGMTNIIILRS